MKKKIIAVLVILIVVLSGCAYSSGEGESYLRIHIRANSNSEVDQNIKYKVRDKVIEYLIDGVNSCDTFDKAKEYVISEQNNIKVVVDNFLAENNFNYVSRVNVKNELFPTREYDGLTLESGYYDALIIELGEGVGDNWWCCIYPNLCFIDGEIKYRSFIVDGIQKLFNRG